MLISHSQKFTTAENEPNANTLILRGFYRNILRMLWNDVEAGIIPPALIGGIGRDVRKILYPHSRDRKKVFHKRKRR